MTGNIDEKVRHANTKLADTILYHLKMQRKGYKNGQDEVVHNTGCPSMDLVHEVMKSQLNI